MISSCCHLHHYQASPEISLCNFFGGRGRGWCGGVQRSLSITGQKRIKKTPIILRQSEYTRREKLVSLFRWLQYRICPILFHIITIRCHYGTIHKQSSTTIGDDRDRHDTETAFALRDLLRAGPTAGPPTPHQPANPIFTLKH